MNENQLEVTLKFTRLEWALLALMVRHGAASLPQATWDEAQKIEECLESSIELAEEGLVAIAAAKTKQPLD